MPDNWLMDQIIVTDDGRGLTLTNNQAYFHFNEVKCDDIDKALTRATQNNMHFNRGWVFRTGLEWELSSSDRGLEMVTRTRKDKEATVKGDKFAELEPFNVRAIAWHPTDKWLYAEIDGQWYRGEAATPGEVPAGKEYIAINSTIPGAAEIRMCPSEQARWSRPPTADACDDFTPYINFLPVPVNGVGHDGVSTSSWWAAEAEERKSERAAYKLTSQGWTFRSNLRWSFDGFNRSCFGFAEKQAPNDSWRKTSPVYPYGERLPNWRPSIVAWDPDLPDRIYAFDDCTWYEGYSNKGFTNDKRLSIDKSRFELVIDKSTQGYDTFKRMPEELCAHLREGAIALGASGEEFHQTKTGMAFLGSIVWHQELDRLVGHPTIDAPEQPETETQTSSDAEEEITMTNSIGNIAMGAISQATMDVVISTATRKLALMAIKADRTDIAEMLISTEGRMVAKSVVPLTLVGLCVVLSKSDNKTIAEPARDMLPALEQLAAAGIGSLGSTLFQQFIGNESDDIALIKMAIAEKRVEGQRLAAGGSTQAPIKNL